MKELLNAGRMPLRWALILVAASVAATVVGGLTLVQSGDWPAALLAGFAAGGASVLGAHQILARV